MRSCCSEVPVHLFQSFPSISAPLSTVNWSAVVVPTDNYIGTLRNAFSKLVDFCQDFQKKLCAEGQ